jgi:hypothetical protein
MSTIEGAAAAPLLWRNAARLGRIGSFLLGVSLFCWLHLRAERMPFPGSPASHDLLLYPAELLAVAVLVRGFHRNPRPVSAGATPSRSAVMGSIRPRGLVLAGAVVWLLAAGISGASAADPVLSWTWTLALALALGCALMGVDRQALQAGLAIGIAVSVPIMLYQVVGQTTWPAGSLNGWPGELTGAVRGTAVLGSQRWLRPYGLTLHPNIAGGFAAVGCVLFAWGWLRGRNPWQLALTSTALAEVLLSFSRSAWLGALLGLALLILMVRQNRGALLLALAVPTVGFAATLGTLALARAEASGQLESDSISQRVYLAGTAVRFWREQPVLGIGPAQFSEHEVQAYGASFTPEPVHNGPLLVLAETGLFGLAGAALFTCGIILSLVQSRDWQRAAAGLALSGPLLLDHYLLTSPMGVILLGVTLAPTVTVD